MQLSYAAQERSAANVYSTLSVPKAPQIFEIDAKAFISNLPKNHLLIYSPTALEKLELDHRSLGCSAVSDRAISINVHELNAAGVSAYCDEITVFGAGRAIDHAKYLAYRTVKKLNIIPSLLSTNAFGTPFGCYEDHTCASERRTMRTGYAHSIFVDFEHLALTGAKDLYGIADVLSIATALLDWDLAAKANPTVVDPIVYEKARRILDRGFNCLENGIVTARTLFGLILDSAFIVGLHGSGRPESGSEHLFSKCIEIEARRKGLHVMHGSSVGLGIAIMARLQENPELDRLISSVRRAKLLDEFKGSIDGMFDLAEHTLAILKPHSERHSIVNERTQDLSLAGFRQELVKRAFSDIFE